MSLGYTHFFQRTGEAHSVYKAKKKDNDETPGIDALMKEIFYRCK